MDQYHSTVSCGLETAWQVDTSSERTPEKRQSFQNQTQWNHEFF